MDSLAFSDDHERDRFYGYVDDSDIEGCWPWTGELSVEGYGKFAVRRDRTAMRRWTTLAAHRVAYFAFFGEIPGETLDHLCHTFDKTCEGGPRCPHRRCCRPSHLEPVSELENIARGMSGIRQLQKDRCPQGHLYAGDNLMVLVRKSGRDLGKRSRMCRECWLERGRAAGAAYRDRQRETQCAVQVLSCQVDAHPWVRPAEGGVVPSWCPDHRHLNPMEKYRNTPRGGIETLICVEGHEWTRARRRGMKPSRCPDHPIAVELKRPRRPRRQSLFDEETLTNPLSNRPDRM